jgi:hypothetical protein
MITTKQARALGIVAGLKHDDRGEPKEVRDNPALKRAYWDAWDAALKAQKKDAQALRRHVQRHYAPLSDSDPLAHLGVRRVRLPD